MPLLDLQSAPSRSMLRWFGLSLAVFLALVAFLIRNWSPALAGTLIGSGLALGLAYYLIPQIQLGVIRGWQYATFPIAFVVGHALLGLAFYCVFWPIGRLLKLRGYDPLSLRPSSKSSQWRDRAETHDASRYFRQY